MPNSLIEGTQQEIIDRMVSLKEIAELLIKHQNIHSGIFQLTFEFQVAFGGVGPRPEEVVPGASFGISRIGLAPSPIENHLTVNAAVINPRKKLRASKEMKMLEKVPKRAITKKS